MLDPAEPPRGADDGRPLPVGTGPDVALPEGAAQAVLAVAAVARLEPTLPNALHQLRTSTNRIRPGTVSTTTAAEGITLYRRESLVDVHVDISITPARPAHLTAAAVQGALRDFLSDQQLTPGTITVAVLTIER